MAVFEVTSAGLRLATDAHTADELVTLTLASPLFLREGDQSYTVVLDGFHHGDKSYLTGDTVTINDDDVAVGYLAAGLITLVEPGGSS
jgi:hypothetical protein